MYKEKIKELLLSTGRKGMDKLIEHMENEGFFTADFIWQKRVDLLNIVLMCTKTH